MAFDMVVIAWYFLNHDDTTNYITGQKNGGLDRTGSKERLSVILLSFCPCFLAERDTRCFRLQQFKTVIGSDGRRRKSQKQSEKMQSATGLPPRSAESTTNGPCPQSREPHNWRRTMSFSHSGKTPSTVTPSGLSGPDALRAYFAPRQVLRLKEAALCLNLSYSHFFRRIQAGTLNLKIRENEVGERFVLIDDLISYIFPPTEQATYSPPIVKKKLGRPRKGTEGGAR